MKLRSISRFRLFVLAALAAPLFAGLPGCGGGDGPPEQIKPELVQLVGTASDGTALSTSATVKGTAGTLRTSTAVGGTQTYAVTLDQLTGPYMVTTTLAVPVYSVALEPGTANATPLTNLVLSQLFATDPASAYAAFGPTNPALAAKVTVANIAAAEAATVAFLQGTVGLTVPASTTHFISQPFKPVAGDPMFDLLVALQARIQVLGSDVYAGMVAAFVRHASLCANESLSLTLAGAAATKFCPATKTAQPEDADSTIVDYVFTGDNGDVLSITARDATVLSASYVPAGASTGHACSASACSGITLGTPNPDLTRALNFANVSLAGTGGPLTISGSLLSAIPGVALPVLPCSDNRFFLIREDRSVVADCVNVSDGGFFGLAGTLGTIEGNSTFADYKFRNSDGGNGLPPADFPPQVFVVLNGSQLVSVTVLHQTTDFDTGVTTTDYDYKCRGSACQGVTVSPPTSNTDSGFALDLRSISFDNTVLAAVNADGSLSSTIGAKLRGTFAAIGSTDPNLIAPLVPPDPAACDGMASRVVTTVADEALVFPSCMYYDGAGFFQTVVQANGDLSLQMYLFGFGDVTVVTDSTGGTVKSASVTIPSDSFGCAGNCSGVAVSAPDADGNRTVTLTSTPLNSLEADGFYTGTRTGTATGVFVVPPPDPSATPSAARQRAKLQRLRGKTKG